MNVVFARLVSLSVALLLLGACPNARELPKADGGLDIRSSTGGRGTAGAGGGTVAIGGISGAAGATGEAGATGAGGSGGGTSATGGTPVIDGGPPGSGGAGACAPDQKLCGGTCVAISDPQYGCDPTLCSATACPNAMGATLVCRAGLCVVGACGFGTKNCAERCVSLTDAAYGCGATTCDATTCPNPGAGGTVACQGGACVIGTCASGTKKCSGKCVAVSDPSYGCGATTCDAATCPSAGTGTLICQGGACVIGACGAGTKKCGDKCVTTDAANGCADAARCTPCANTEACVGTPAVCTCVPTVLATVCAGKCGMLPNGCGGMHICTGTCTSPQTCGGGGTPNVCGCTPPMTMAAACAGKCGPVPNGCGTNYACQCGGSTPICQDNVRCIAKKRNGESCGSAATDCESGNCQQGFCCNAVCSGNCESCATPASRGTCVPTTTPKSPCMAPSCTGSSATTFACNGSPGCTASTTQCPNQCKIGGTTCAPCPQPNPENRLLINPGFDGTVSPWVAERTNIHTTVDVDNCNGSGSALVRDPLSGNPPTLGELIQCVKTTGNGYFFGYRYRALSAGSSGTCNLHFFTNTNCAEAGFISIEPASSTLSPDASTWVDVKTSFNLPAGTRSAKIACNAVAGAGYYDKFYLSPASTEF